MLAILTSMMNWLKMVIGTKKCFPDGCQQNDAWIFVLMDLKNRTFHHTLAPFFINDVSLVPLTGCTPKKSHYPDFWVISALHQLVCSIYHGYYALTITQSKGVVKGGPNPPPGK